MTARGYIVDGDVTLALLAGGAGARMGQPKAMLSIGGRPILEVLVEQLRWPGPTMLVTAPGRERPPGSARFDREVVDPIANGGPLVGICTALTHVQTELLVVATVDMPGVGPGQLRWLQEMIGPAELGMMGSRPGAEREQIEPFPSIFRAEAREVLQAHLAMGHRSVHSILKDARFVARKTPADWPSSVWANLNYPADVTAFDQPPTQERDG